MKIYKKNKEQKILPFYYDKCIWNIELNKETNKICISNEEYKLNKDGKILINIELIENNYDLKKIKDEFIKKYKSESH